MDNNSIDYQLDLEYLKQINKNNENTGRAFDIEKADSLFPERFLEILKTVNGDEDQAYSIFLSECVISTNHMDINENKEVPHTK